MSTSLGSKPSRGLLVDQMSKSKELEPEVTAFYRDDGARTYQLRWAPLIGSMP